MKCPYCGNEMEQGLIQSPHELAWVEGEKRHIFSRAKFYEGALVLSKISLWRGSAVTAWLCRDCGKVIIDVADEKSDLNQR